MPGSELGEKAIFNVARTIQSPEAREEYLRQVCGDDTGLRNRVTELLHGFQQGESFLESPAEGVAATIQTLSECTGDSIGAYKLIEQIGEGGMGIVYMAEQKEPVRRTVALKIIKPGMDTKQVVARFEAERQALALMNHPNVAKVLDAGATDSGRPYFVMELVRGIPMTDFCDKQKLDTRQRLELFASVCQAVQHAHQKGIIHRDIKPTNILVELHDVKAVPKVIDFGVAKATTHNLTEHSLHTGFSQMIGTPLYMSPEQAELSGLDIDTRTDIYSLGVLLYELLSGTTPFDRKTLRQASYDEMRRIIREDEPEKPSDRISTLAADSLSTISEQRDCDPRRLTQTVRGELDWIAMKALDKDRTRRYESASAMAADVQNYLNDEPVVACPPTATYRFGKFARRNKVQLFVASVVVVTMVLGIVGLFVSNQLITQQRNEANNQKEIAEENFRKAREAVDEYLMKVSNIQLENVPELQPLRKDLLNLALKYYQGFVAEHGDDPTLQVDLASAYFHIGQIAGDIGSKQEAFAAHEKWFEIRKRLVAGDPTNADYRSVLGKAYAQMGAHQGNHDLQKAVASIREGLKIQSENAKDHPGVERYEEQLAATYHLLGNQLWHIDNNDLPKTYANDVETVAAFSAEVKILENLVEKYPDKPDYQSRLAWAHVESGRKKDVFDPETLQRAIDLMEKLVTNHPDDVGFKESICKLYGNQGLQQSRDGNYEAAVVTIRRGMTIQQDLVNREPKSSRHQFILQRFHHITSTLQSELGKHAEAVESSRTAVELLKKLIEKNPEIPSYRDGLVDGSHYLGKAYHETGALTEAVAAYRDAAITLEWLIAKYPNRFDDRQQARVRETYRTLVAELKLQRHEEVEEFVRTRLEMWNTFQVEVGNVGGCMATRAELHLDLGEWLTGARRDADASMQVKSALELARKAVELKPNGAVDDDDEWHVWSRAAVVYYRERDWEGAEVEARSGITLANGQLNKVFYVAPLLWLAGKEEEYRQVCRGLLDASPNESEAEQSDADAHLVRMFGLDRGAVGEPERVLEIALRAIGDKPDDAPAWKMFALGRAYYRAGKYELAVKSLHMALEDPGVSAEALISLDLAIAHHLAGHPDEAREWLRRATELIDASNSKPLIGDEDIHPHEALEIEVLRREAEQLIRTPRESAAIQQQKD